MDMAILLKAVGAGLLTYGILTAAFTDHGDMYSQHDAIPDGTVIPIYREIALRNRNEKSFIVFNSNTIFLLIIIIMIAFLMEWMQDETVMRVTVKNSEENE